MLLHLGPFDNPFLTRLLLGFVAPAFTYGSIREGNRYDSTQNRGPFRLIAAYCGLLRPIPSPAVCFCDR